MAAGRAWLVDASIYIFRAWFSLPDRWHTPDGRPVSAVYGYGSFLLDFIGRVGTAFHGAAAFDESLGSNFRNDIYPDYKCSRELPDQDLAFQLDACRRLTEYLGLPCYGGARYEADDYIASLARRFQSRAVPVTIVTRDKDLGQVLNGPDDRWWDFAADEELDAGAFSARFGVTPSQFGDYLALVGDPVDDIPGVPGIGAKTAAALLQAFGDLRTLERSLPEVGVLPLRGAATVQARLEEHWHQVLLSRRLTALETRIPRLGASPRFRLRPAAVQRSLDYLGELGLAGPLARRLRALGEAVA